MLETTDRQGTPQPPEGGVPSAHDAETVGAALAALPAPELPELEAQPPRRRRGVPRGLRLVIRCRPKRRSGLSLLARLTGRQRAEELAETPSLESEELSTSARPEDQAAPLGPFDEPFANVGGERPEEAWNLDLFADSEPEPRAELDGPLTWAEPDLEIERDPEPQPEPGPAVAPSLEIDQSLLIDDLTPRVQGAGPLLSETFPALTMESLQPESVDAILEARPLPEPSLDENREAESLPQAEPLLRGEPLPEAARIVFAEAIDLAEPAGTPEPILAAEQLSEPEGQAETLPVSEPLLPAEPTPEAGLTEESPSETAAELDEAEPELDSPSCFEAVHGPRAQTRTYESDSFAWSTPPRQARLPGSMAWALPALLPALLAWLAPPLAGALAAGLAAGMGAFVRRPSRPFRQAILALAWAGLALSTAAAAGSLLAPISLSVPGLPWTWPSSVLAPGALAGLAAVALAGLLMPGRGAARLAALAGPGAGALALALAGASPTASLLAGAALCAAALEGSSRLTGWRRAPQRFHLRAWAIAGVGAIAATVLAVVLTAAAIPPLASLLALVLLGAATTHRALDLAEKQRATALLAGGGALMASAAALTVLGLWTGLALPAALSLALLAPASAHAERWRRAQAWKEAIPEPPGLAFLARTLTACLSLLIVVAFLLEAAPVAWTTAAAALLILCACCAAERVLRGPAAFALAAIALGTAAGCALFMGAGLSPAWLPAGLMFGFAAPLLSGERLPGRTRRKDWERPILAASGFGLASSLLLCLVDPAAGLAGVLAAGAAPLPLLRSSQLVRRSAPVFLGLVPVGAALASGAWTSTVSLLALAAFVSWALARRSAELLPAAALLALSSGLLALPLAMTGNWQASSGALLILGLLGATDFLDAREAAASRARAAAGLAVCGLGGAAGIAAAALAGPSLPAVLLVAALLLQAIDLLTRDGRLSRWLRPGASLTWLAGLVAIAPQAVAAPARGAALVGAAAGTALVLSLLRRERLLAFVAGLCAAVATGLVSLAAGLDPLLAPALFLAPTAVWVVAWGIFESVEERDPNAFLAGGLGLLGAAALLQVHATDAPTIWRAAAIGLGSLLVVGGAATKHRVPVLLGAILLALESAVLVVDGIRLGAERPLVLAGVLASLALSLGVAAWQLCHRAGGRAALRMAWQGDWLRALAEWRRWR